ncbi:MAG: hypothetical protein Q7S68_04195 [Deltaproteobacteria bacterium]|nr:hypothetical protein [Deltaproteobacteria bacterium]
MMLIDYLVNLSFQKSKEGKSLFFPTGMSNKGYEVDSLCEEKIRKYLRTLYLSALIVTIFSVVFFGIFTLTLIPVFWFVDLFYVDKLLKGQKQTTEPGSFSSPTAMSATLTFLGKFQLFILLFFFCMATLFGICSLYVDQYKSVSILGALSSIFIFMLVVLVLIIRGLKNLNKKSDKKIQGKNKSSDERK